VRDVVGSSGDLVLPRPVELGGVLILVVELVPGLTATLTMISLGAHTHG